MKRLNSFYVKGLVLVVIAALAAAIGACSDDTTAPPPNERPTIDFNVTKWATTQQATETFTALVSDPDDDPLTVTWAVVRDGQPSGSLNAADQGSPTMRWTAPIEVGRDSIIVTVTDGKGGKATAVETIQVGTLRSASSVSVSQTWTAANAPYVIQPAAMVYSINERVTLTIDAGVQVYIDKPGLDISVVGRLIANGTQSEPVLIRMNSRDAESGDWQGITGNPSGQSNPRIELTHTKILHAVDAVRANETAMVALDGCRIMFSRDHAVLHQSRGALSVENSVITNNNKTGIRVVRGTGVENPLQVIIRGDSIVFNGDTGGGTQYVDDAGIVIDLEDPNGAVDIDIACNEISINGTPGIQLNNSTYPIIHHNSISRNEFGKPTGRRFNIRLDDGFSGNIPTLDARYNWWGAALTNPADSVIIKETIRDIDNGPGTGITVRVIVDPWLLDWPDPSCQ